jgi:hypothetical protein
MMQQATSNAPVTSQHVAVRALAAGGADYDVGGKLPGIATRAEANIDTFADRLSAELAPLGAWTYLPELAGAWIRVPVQG